MNEFEKTIAYLAGIGALVAVGRALTSAEPVSWHVFIGRVILGSALATVAGMLLIPFPNAPLPVLCGAGAAIGILGEQVLVLAVRRFIAFKFGRGKST